MLGGNADAISICCTYILPAQIGWLDLVHLMMIVGVRPQIIKLGPLMRALERHHDVRIIHTGQHYDNRMSRQFFGELSLPEPEFLPQVMRNESRLERLAGTLSGLDAVMRRPLSPDLVIVIGDSDPAFAGAVAAATIGFPVAHIEAGLRSFDNAEPEEHNRKCIDALAIMHFAPTATCRDNLLRENIASGVMCGDLHLDALKAMMPSVLRGTAVCSEFDLQSGQYLVATIHRASTLVSPSRLADVCDALAGSKFPVIWPMHPGTLRSLRSFDLLKHLVRAPNILLADAQPYARMLSLMHHCRAVLTDSGGVQREAFFLERPCIVLRSATEFAETINSGGAQLTFHDSTRLRSAMAELLDADPQFTVDLELFGGGRAAERIANAIDKYAATESKSVRSAIVTEVGRD